MIIRAWRGYATLEKPEDYPDHFRRNVVPELKGIDGFLGARLMRSQTLEGFEFLVHTRWRSMDAIRAFAGDDIERAVVEPEAVRALTHYDKRARHYVVVEDQD
ncbi:antibiotic biosynthesis monooxygenase [Mesorhizobium sp. 1M-11]|uniref:antibiotic biosynthesis monooxygenase n=1 Tax=Mesorhizobium sp. 1M-11 TaxID=1529006 RepID=UPI0006C74AFA|nr:antibiotic biosynthesis monooxygenase [Mesorhizobium sp. 1M-11]